MNKFDTTDEGFVAVLPQLSTTGVQGHEEGGDIVFQVPASAMDNAMDRLDVLVSSAAGCGDDFSALQRHEYTTGEGLGIISDNVDSKPVEQLSKESVSAINDAFSELGADENKLPRLTGIGEDDDAPQQSECVKPGQSVSYQPDPDGRDIQHGRRTVVLEPEESKQKEMRA